MKDFLDEFGSRMGENTHCREKIAVPEATLLDITGVNSIENFDVVAYEDCLFFEGLATVL